MATHKPIDILASFTELPPPIDYVLPNMVAGTVGALVSPGGAGKSMLALQLAMQIAGGPDLLGEFKIRPDGPLHRALPDAKATAELLLIMQQKHPSKQFS